MWRVSLVFWAVLGCTSDYGEGVVSGVSHNVPVSSEAAESKLTASDMPPNTTKLMFGVTPYLTPEVIREHYQPIAKYLSVSLGLPVELVITDSYEDQIEKVVRGELDIVSLSPLSYVLAKQRTPQLKIVSNELAMGNTGFSSYIIVRSDSPYKSLEDLKGARFVFVDENSTSGFLFPYAAFLDARLDPNVHLKDIRFAGGHLNAIYDLATGKADAAATGSGMLGQAAKHKYGDKRIDVGSIRILKKVGRIPYDAVCVRGAFPESGVEKILATFSRLNTRNAEGRAVLAQTAGITGFMPVKNERYDGVRETLKKVEAHRDGR